MMQIDYIKALDTGHQYQLSLYPSTCDLTQSFVQQNLAVTAQTKASLPSFSIQIQKTGSGLYLMNLILEDNLLQKATLDVILGSLNAKSYAPKIFIPDAMMLSLAEHAIAVKTTITSTLATTFPGTVLLHLTSALWSLVNFQQFVSYFVFINIEFPFQVKLFFLFTQPQVWDFVPNPLSSLTNKLSQDFPNFNNDDAEESRRPQKFIDEDKTSSFIENGGGIFAINIEILLLFLLLFLLRKIPFFLRRQSIQKVYKNLRWNIIFRLFLENSTPLAFALFLQGRVLSLDNAYHYTVFSLMICSSVYFSIMLVSIIRILSQRTIIDLNNEDTEKKYGTLYEGVKLTDEASKYYYLILLIRGIVVTFLVAFADSLPLLQIVILISYNVFLVWYLFKNVVFKSRALTIICRANQILILVAEIVILCLAFETSSNLYYSVLGWLISDSMFIALILELGYLGVVQVMKIKDVWHGAKRLWRKIGSLNRKRKKVDVQRQSIRLRPRPRPRQDRSEMADTSVGPLNKGV